MFKKLERARWIWIEIVLFLLTKWVRERESICSISWAEMVERNITSFFFASQNIIFLLLFVLAISSLSLFSLCSVKSVHCTQIMFVSRVNFPHEQRMRNVTTVPLLSNYTAWWICWSIEQPTYTHSCSLKAAELNWMPRFKRLN